MRDGGGPQRLHGGAHRRRRGAGYLYLRRRRDPLIPLVRRSDERGRVGGRQQRYTRTLQRTSPVLFFLFNSFFACVHRRSLRGIHLTIDGPETEEEYKGN